MYHLAIVTLTGLAILKVADLLDELVPGLARVRTVLVFLLGVTVAVALDYSIFEGFGVTVREQWMGTWATGLIIGSLATAWKVVFGYLGAAEGTPSKPGRNERPRIAA